MASTIRYYSNMKTFIRVIKRTFLFLEMIRAHCELFPGSIQPHPYQCAQYFDCGPTIGGSYLRECKYPQLFDEVSYLACLTKYINNKQSSLLAKCKIYLGKGF
jgi:hypothetical protein